MLLTKLACCQLSEVHKVMTAAVRIDPTLLSLEDLSRLREMLRVGPGQRSLETQAAIERRNDLIRRLARRFYPGRSRNQQAESIHRDLARYAGGSWRTASAAAECPHRDERRQLLWRVLKARDRVPTARFINDILKSRGTSR
ncbi:hypothetical protein ACVIWU_004492 [Bradyrhizobium sp. USDA 4509]